MGNLTFAVAGNGPANQDNIYELLCDWLGFGEKDEEGYYTGEGVKYEDIRLILPLTDEHFTPGVAAVHRWSALANLEFIGVISATTPPTRRDVKGAKGETDDLVPATDILVKITELLADCDPGDERVLLVLHEDTDPDEETRALIEAAFERGITDVRNLSYGLAPIEPPAAPEPEPEPQGYAALADAQDEEDHAYHEAQRQRAREVVYREADSFVDSLRQAVAVGEGGPVEITYSTRHATAINVGREMEGDPLANIFHTLEKLLQFHIAYDTITRVQHTGIADGPGSALTDDLLRSVVILERLLHGGREQAPRSESAAAPVTVAQESERPQKSAKTRTEWYDETEGAWKPKGRGRPRKDVKTREVPIED